MSIQHVLEDLRLNRFSLSTHAVLRMSERGVVRHDLQAVGETCRTWELQRNGRYRVRSRDAEGDELTVICVYDGDTLVVTLY